MNPKARECPHCRRQVSVEVCSKYFLRGTAYTVRCNHCDTELALIREPVPFKWCPLAGFLSVVIPGEYFLFVRHICLIKSLTYAALFGILTIGVIAFYTIKRIYFKRA